MKEILGRGLSYGVIKDIDFVLRQGEVVVMMGPNGGGKSTLARLISGLVKPELGNLILNIQGQEIPWVEVKQWQEVGIIGQHPRRQTIGATVQEELSYGLLNLGWDISTVRKTIYSLAEKIGLKDKLNQSPTTLSGGERQRLVLVAILAMNPSFLILDEAMSMLDEKSQRACLDLLREKNREMGQLWITHDPHLALQGERLWIMDGGRLLDVGSPEEKLRDKEFCQKYSLRYIDNSSYHMVPNISNINCATNSTGAPPDKMVSLPAQSATHLTSNDLEIWEKYSRIQSLRQRKSPRPNSSTVSDKKKMVIDEASEKIDHANLDTKGILEWHQASYNSRLYLDENIKEKNFLAILGSSGAGKSTLLESAIALIKPTTGKFRAFGKDIIESKGELRQKVRLVLQEPGEYFIGTNVYEEIFYLKPQNLWRNFFSKWGMIPSKTIQEKKENLDLDLEYLQTVGIFSDKAYAYLETLSGGERQRVALGAALESLPEVLLLDEPLLGLDSRGSEMFLNLLGGLKGRLTILYVTHNLWEVEELADEVWLIEDGCIQFKCAGRDIKAYRKVFKEAGVRC